MQRLRSLRRRGLAAVAALAAASAVACGAGSPGGSVPEAASYVPATAPFFLSIATDTESEQWQAARRLLERVPAGAELLEQLPEEGLGPEVGLAVLELETAAGEPPLALVARPDDPAGFVRRLKESDDRPAWRELAGGWYVVAGDEARLEQVTAGARSAPLAEHAAFRDAFESIPDDALACLYFDGAALAEAAGGQLAGGALPVDPAVAAGLEWAAAAIQAESEGLRVEGLVRSTAAAAELATFSPELASLVPADALAYAGFADARAALEEALSRASAEGAEPGWVEQAELLLGVGVERDLLPLFEGEHALFVRAGAPVPELTLILSPADPRRTLATLDKLAAGLPRLAQAAGDEAPFSLSESTVAGATVKTLAFVTEDVSLSYALVDEHVVLSTQAKGIADVAAGAAALADDPLYRGALAAAGLDSDPAGIGFVDFDAAVSLLATLAPAPEGGVGVDASGLEPLRSLLVAATGEGDELRVVGFLELD